MSNDEIITLQELARAGEIKFSLYTKKRTISSEDTQDILI